MSSSLHRRGVLRALLTGGVVVAVALLPGTAGAADDPLPDPTTTVPGTVEEVLPAEPAPLDATGDEVPPTPGPAAAEGEGEEQAPPDLLARLAEEGPFPPNCAAGVEAAIAGLVALLTNPERLKEFAAELEAYVTALLADPTKARDPLPAPEGIDPKALEDALTALADALEKCLTPPTTEPSEEPTDPTESPGPVSPAAPSPAAQPVTYPGYAPTGATSPDRDDALAPLAAVGGALLLGGGGLVVARSRRRSG